MRAYGAFSPKTFSAKTFGIALAASVAVTGGIAVIPADSNAAGNNNLVQLSAAQAQDLHITKVEESSPNVFTLTRNDNKTFKIDVSDLAKRIKALEDADFPTKAEFDKLRNEFKTIQDFIDKMPDDTPGKLKLYENKIVKEIPKQLDGLEKRITNVENATIVKVKNDGKGTYTLIRKDGKPLKDAIVVGDGITNITDNGDGTITITKTDGSSTKITLSNTTVTETGKGTPNHTVTISAPGGKKVSFTDTYITDVKLNAKGDYDIYRSDIDGGKKVWRTIELGKLKDSVKKLEEKESPSKADFDGLKHDLGDVLKLAETNADLAGKNADKILKMRGEIKVLDGRVDKLEERMGKAEGNAINRIEPDGKGGYTIVRENGKLVGGKIDTGGNVKTITAKPDGSIVLHKVDGTTETVKLAQTKITEKNKGTPKHTVTITSPNGDTVTFNAFDIFITNVAKNKDGDYDIYRSDIGGGTKVWKTIKLSDIRGKIAALEAEDSPNRQEFNKVVSDLKKLNKEIDARLDGIEGDVDQLKADVKVLNDRASDLEARVGKLEETDKAWAKCASGVGIAAIPSVLALPLGLLSTVQLPGVAEFNTQVQQNLGMFNPELAKMWGNSGGVLGAAAAASLLAGVIGAIAYASDQCGEYNQTEYVKETKIGELSSKAQ